MLTTTHDKVIGTGANVESTDPVKLLVHFM